MTMVKFQLRRYAALTLEKKIMTVPNGQQMYFHDVAVEFVNVVEAPSKIIMHATTYFEAKQISGIWDRNVGAACARAEVAITAAADVLAIATCGGRTIESCAPHLSVAWPNGTTPDIGHDWEISRVRTIVESVGNRYVELSVLAGGIQDRLSGVALMSLALSNSNGHGKYLAYCSVFEDAFGLAASQIGKKLAQFLKNNPVDLRYSRDEVRGWLELRGGASHADLNGANAHVLESDVMKFIPRMQQAAFDVLLNKKIWHDKSHERRNLGRPSIVFRSDPLHIFATVNQPVDYQYKLVDPFCEWPIASDCRVNLSGNIAFPRLNAAFPTTMEVIPP